MQDSEQSDSLIKTPVQKLVGDLTEKYVRETVKQSAQKILQKKGQQFSREMDCAWKDASEKDKEQFSKDLEDRISREILNSSTDAIDLQKRIDSVIDEQINPAKLGPVRLEPSRKSREIETTSSKKTLKGYLIKIFIALLLISAGIYFALPVIFPAELSVSTTKLDFGIMEQRVPSPLTFSINNQGRGTLTWNVYSDDPWIGLEPASGTNDGLVTVSIRGKPQAGALKGVINVQADSHQSRRIEVSLRVLSAPGISIHPPILTFIKRLGERQRPASQTLRIINSGEQTLEWNAAADRSWITMSNYEGINDGEVQVGINGDQRPGTYHGTIAIISNDKNIDVPVTLEVIEPARLSVSPNPLNFDFQAYTAQPPDPQTFSIANNGGEPMSWHISSEPWITATPTSGELQGGSSQEISIGIDTLNLDYTDRIGNLAIDSNGGSATGRVQLKRAIMLK
ncbi:MAG: hypothetical protein A4E49_01959 [Methanosaeta sp. PtaU1.Bin112]|nr:MAG: hypothetical protein A4E49_01959 [Methanosaeta sp. PtaU1.Bin112]